MLRKYIPTEEDLTTAIGNALIKRGSCPSAKSRDKCAELAAQFIMSIFGKNSCIALCRNNFPEKEDKKLLRCIEKTIGDITETERREYEKIRYMGKDENGKSIFTNWKVWYLILNKDRIDYFKDYSLPEVDPIVETYETAFANEEIWDTGK